MKRTHGLVVFSLILMHSSASFGQIDQVLKNFGHMNKTASTCSVSKEYEFACDSMSTLSCKQGTFDDGTGKVLSKEAYQAKIDPMKVKVLDLYQTSILKIMKDNSPENSLVRTLALGATKQNATSACMSKKKSELDQCFAKVAENLAKIQLNKAFVDPTKGGASSAGIDFELYSSLMRNQVFINATDLAHQKSLALVTDHQLTKKIEKDIFPRVKKILIQKIKENIKDEKVLAAMVKKIENIHFNGSDCSSKIIGSNGESTINGLLITNADYSPVSQSFRFCNGYLLKNSSEFAIARTISHELSHAIDPCNIIKPKGAAPFSYDTKPGSKDLESQYPFQGIIGCLRTAESVAAKKFEDGDFGADPNPFCSSDQITESFSDWMAAEVLPDYISKYHSNLSQNQKMIGYSNSFRVYCGVKKAVVDPEDVHPDVNQRIDRILMANPNSRKLMGCGEPKGDLRYCKVGDVK